MRGLISFLRNAILTVVALTILAGCTAEWKYVVRNETGATVTMVYRDEKATVLPGRSGILVDRPVKPNEAKTGTLMVYAQNGVVLFSVSRSEFMAKGAPLVYEYPHVYFVASKKGLANDPVAANKLRNR